MEKYYYKCFDCGKEYSRKEIESKLIYLCPACGAVEKNRPLKGILLIEYDYKWIKKNYSAKEFKQMETGRFWQYGLLWPLDYEKNNLRGVKKEELNLISLSSNCFQELSYNGRNFQVLDDTRNPTLSFKDRASSLVVLKAIQMGIKEIAAASTGNAGSSLAGICARLGLKSKIFVPRHIPESKRIQIQSFGADVVLVDGDYDLAFDTCLEFSSKKKWYNRNTAYNPLTIEGKKSAAYDIFISTKGKIPDIIFVPTGDGVIISGIYKGFWELKQLGWIKKIPELIAVQSAGGDAVARYCKTGKFEYRPAHSIADSISAGAPRCLYYTHHAILSSNGSVVTVTDKEILDAQEKASRQFGILLEPSSAASFAGFIKYGKTNSYGKKMPLLLFTGNGLKDTSALMKWNKPVSPMPYKAIKKKYNVK